MKVLFFHVFIVALCALSACGGINRYFDGITSDSYTPTVRLIKESPESVIELSPDDPQYKIVYRGSTSIFSIVSVGMNR